MLPIFFVLLIFIANISYASQLQISEVPWQVTFVGREYANERTTFTYDVNCLSVGGNAYLAKLLIALPDCSEVDVVSTAPSTDLTIIADPLSGVNGLQWPNTHVIAGTHQTFTITIQGHVEEESLQFVVFGAGDNDADFAVGSVIGPSCSFFRDTVCDAGGTYSASCVDHNILVSLTSLSQQAITQEWSVQDSQLHLDNPTSINPLLTIEPSTLRYNLITCEAVHRVTLTVYGEDSTAEHPKSCEAIILVNDTEAPQFLGLYAEDMTVESDDVPAIPDVRAKDQCDSNVVVTPLETAVGDNPASRLLIRTWSATDICHNNRIHVQTITVQDSTPPELRGVEEDVTAECDAVPPPCEVEAYDYNDVTVTMSEARYDDSLHNCDHYYTLVRTWTATDAAGLTAVESQTITVQDNRTPVISGAPDHETVECDNVPAAPDLVAMDSCGSNTLTFQSVTREGASVNDYEIIRTWTATDLCDNVVFHAQTITVQDTHEPLLSGVDADATVLCYEIPEPCVVTVVDNCDELVEVEYGQEKIPMTCEDQFDLQRTWTATDVSGQVASETQILRIRDVVPPKFTGLPPATLTVECSDIPQFVVTATDKCDPSVTVGVTESQSTTITNENEYNLYRSWVTYDRCGNQAQHTQMLIVQDTVPPTLEGVPHDIAVSCNSVPLLENSYVTVNDKCSCADGLFVSSQESTFHGSCTDEYTLVRTWSSQDCSANLVTQTQTITVTDTERPVMVGLPGDRIVQCDAIPDAAIVEVSDNCDELIAVEPEEEIVTGACPYDYTLVRIWTSTDACGNSIQHQQHITVEDNSPPSWTNPDDGATYSFECAGDPRTSMNLADYASPAATDTCDPSVAVSFVDHETVSDDCVNDITVVREYTATDDCGNTATQVLTFNVDDTTAPTLESSFDADVTVEFPATDYLDDVPDVTGLDNCDGTVDVSVTEDSESWPPCPQRSFKVIRKWGGTDLCGNVSPLLEQVINVEDSTPPVIINGPPDLVVGCHEIPPAATVTATDADGGDVTVTLTEITSSQTCLNSYLLTRTWVAYDVCGNDHSVDQVITVEDNEAPVLLGVPDDLTTECELPSPPTVTVEDGCDSNVTVGAPTEVQVAGVGEIKFVVTRTWTAVDSCQNSVTRSQVITIKDTLAPVIEDVPDGVTAECSDELGETPLLEGVDGCDADIAITTDVRSFPSDICADMIIYHRTWMASDEAGHSVTVEQVVVVKDTQGPTFTSVPPHSTIECSDPVVEPVVAVEDLCDPDIDEPTMEVSEMHVENSPQYEYARIYEFTAVDRCGNTNSAVVTITIRDTIPPTFDNHDSLVELSCDEDIHNQPSLTGADNCYDVTPTFVDDVIDQPCDDTYILARVWTVVDGSGNILTTTQSFYVTDAEPPVIHPGPPSSIEVSYLNVPPYPELSVSDNCAEVTPSWTNTTDIVNCDNGYRLVYVATVTDDCGLQDTFVQYVNVVDVIAPAIVPQYEDVTIECDEVDNLESMATVSTDDPSATIVSTESIPEDYDCQHSYRIRRVWISEDDCGNRDTYTQVVTVLDRIDPVLNVELAEVTVYCEYSVPNVITGTDNCASEVVDITPVVTRINEENPSNYQLVYTWTYSDPCSNTATEVVTVTVIDNVPPEMGDVPVDVTVHYDDIPIASADTVVCTDNCLNVIPSYEVESIEGSCVNHFKLVRKWTCTDNAGLTVSEEMTVSVEDDYVVAFTNYPVDMTVSWIPGLPTSIPVEEVRTDREGITVSYTTSNTADPDPANDLDFIIIRIWTAVDECANALTHVQTIEIVTPSPPVLPEFPADVYINCDDIGDWLSGEPNQIETISQLISVNIPVDNALSKTERIEPGSCPNQYNYIVTWTATDEAGQEVSDEFTIFVSDTVPPVWTEATPSLVTSECDVPPVPAVDATDNCAQDFIPEGTDGHGDSIGPILDVSDSYTMEIEGDGWVRTWTATDACGNSITKQQRVQVFNNVQPVFDAPGIPANTAVDCNDDLTQIDLTATDNCDGPLAVDATSSSEFHPCEYVIVNSWTATDSTGMIATGEQRVTVRDTTNPTFSEDPLPPTQVTYECGSVPTAPTLTGSDDCGAAHVSYEENIVDPSCTPYTITRKWTVTDDCGLFSEHVQNIVVEDTVYPVLSGIPADETRECLDLAPEPVVTVSDECDAYVLFNLDTETISGTCPDSNTVRKTWTVSDCSGHVVPDSTVTQDVTYLDTTPPTIIGLTTGNRHITITCPSTVAPDPPLTVSDNCDAQPSLDKQEVTISETNTHNYVVERTWTTSDNCGNSAEDTQTVVFEDVTPPTIVCASTQQVLCNLLSDGTPAESFIIPPFSDDSCSEVTLSGPTFIEKINENCQGDYQNVYSWSVVDESGLEASCTQTLEVYDDAAPYFEITPVDITLTCQDSIPDPAIVSIVDSCSSAFSYNLVVDNVPGSCDDEYSLHRQWDAYDDCGHHELHTQVLSILDNDPPTLHGVPDNDDFSCENVPQINNHGVTASDICDGDVHVTFETEITNTECEGGTYEHTLTWSAVDRCGNDVEVERVVDVYDNTPPTLDGVPDDVTVDCANIPDVPEIIAVDNCHPDSIANLAVERIDGPSTWQYTNIYTWQSADPCGNEREDSQRVVVTDDIPPTFNYLPVDATYNCNDVWIIGSLTAEDNCLASADVDKSDPYTIIGTCDFEYKVATTWTAVDIAGNEAQVSQTLSFIDEVPPVILNQPGNEAVECDQIPPAAPLQVSDDCTDDIHTVSPTDVKESIETVNDYSLLRTWVAEDACGNQATYTQTIFVHDTTYPQFSVDDVLDVEVSCDDVPDPVVITGTDNCVENIVVTYEEQTQTGSCVHDYILFRTWSATDATGWHQSISQRVDVSDTQPPNLYHTQNDVTLSCDQALPEPTATAHDLCSGDLTSDIQFVEHVVPGVSASNYHIIREWVVSDLCGLEADWYQTIVVNDIVPPVIQGNPDSTVEIGNVPVPGTATVQDACDTTVPPEVPCVESKVESGTCLYNYTLLYLCTVSDASANYAEHTYTVEVQDTTPPVFYFEATEGAGIAPPAVTVEYGEQPSIDDSLMGVVAVDNSEHEIIINLPDEEVIMPDPTNTHEFIMIWTYTACDDCGNCARIDRTITVEDTTPPCLSEEPPNEEIDCDNIPPPCIVTTVDEDLLVVETFSDILIDENGAKYITRTWSATDASGNSVSHTQTLFIVDNSPPVFSRYPESDTVSCSCDSFPIPPELNVIDNCDFPTVHFSQDKIEGISPDSYALERIWFAVDQSGNEARHVQVITVEDRVPPVLSRSPEDAFVECSNIPDPENVYIKDDCDPEIGVNFEETSILGVCDDEYQIQRFWSGSDRSGNSVNHRQEINVRDTRAPVFQEEDSVCILATPEFQYKEFSTSDLFVAVDNCDTVSYATGEINIYSCNSTHNPSANSPGYFDVNCHFDAGRSILSVLAHVEADEVEGRTYFVYAESTDRCGNQAFMKREFWVPALPEDAAMLGLVCEDADRDRLPSDD